MEEYLFRVSVEKEWYVSIKQTPIYVVAESKEDAEKCVKTYMRDGYKVKKIQRLAKQLSGKFFYGK